MRIEDFPLPRLSLLKLAFNCTRKTVVIAQPSFFLQIAFVDDFVCSVNSHLTTRQENERLKGIMARIESYDVVVS